VLAEVLLVVYIGLTVWIATYAYLSIFGERAVVEEGFYSRGGSAVDITWNVAVFIAMVMLATFAIYLMIRGRKFPLVKFVAIAAWAMLIFSLNVFYVPLIAEFLGLSILDNVVLLSASLLITIVATTYIAIGNASKIPYTILLVSYGSLAGHFLRVVIWSESSIIALAVALSVYDIVMVYKGPLGEIVRQFKGPSRRDSIVDIMRGFVVRVGNLALGMGDVIIYSMVLSYIAWRLNVVLFVESLALMWIGLVITEKTLLRKFNVAPALPLPLLMSLMPLVVHALFRLV